MTEDLTVSEYEHDVTRVFAVNADEADAKAFLGDRKAARVAEALGVPEVDPTYVDVVKIRDLGDIGLRGFLGEGHGIEDSLMERDAGRLDALSGTALVVGSAAFRGQPETLNPGPELTHIATYRVDARDASMKAMPHGHKSGADIMREGAANDASEAEPVSRSNIRWIVIGAIIVAAVLVALVAF